MYTEDQLYDMDDDQLEAAFKEAKADMASPNVEEDLDTSADVEVDAQDNVEQDEDNESGVEQPEEDSDHDASTEEDKEDTDEEESDSDEDKPDGESKADEEQSESGVEAKSDEVQPVQKHKFKANGKEYEFTEDEIKAQFPKVFGQAMDYTKKLQSIKPWRKTIDAIESAKLNHDDVNLMIDVLKGDKDAISEVIKRTGVDALDLNVEESNYVAKDYGLDESALAIKDVLTDISRDREFAVTEDILSNRWDDTSWETVSGDPEMIKLLHEDVKTGMYDKLQPTIDKLKLFDGGKKSDLEYYETAAVEYAKNLQNEQQAQEAYQASLLAKEQQEQEAQRVQQEKLANVQATNEAREATKEASKKRKAAAPTKSGTSKPAVVDYLDDSDEAFDEWYAKVQAKI